jgi:hypothetical protein
MIKRLRSTHDDRRNGIKESNALVIQGKLISVGKDDGDGRLLMIADLLQVLSQHLLPAGMSTSGIERGHARRDGSAASR